MPTPSSSTIRTVREKLETRVDGLKHVVYHNKLGSQAERMLRVKTMAGLFADLIGADRAKAERAAMLAKADLRTLMVGEFPELQGIMGEYYAKYDGEAEEVALAIREHYQPRYAGDALPSTPVSLATALADKMETLIGLFGIGQMPTGERTRSRFAATPSACCACSSKRPCLSASTR